MLEQRDGPEHRGRDHFRYLDDLRSDSIALSDLPTFVTGFIHVNYPQDSLLKAYRGDDSSYVVLNKDNGLYATVFNKSGAFVKRIELSNQQAGVLAVHSADLPGAVYRICLSPIRITRCTKRLRQ